MDPQIVPSEFPAEPNKTAEENKLGNRSLKIPRLDRPVNKWVWTPFKNAARSDNPNLCHWTKSTDVNQEYPFARFNKKPKVISYTNEEYEKVV